MIGVCMSVGSIIKVDSNLSVRLSGADWNRVLKNINYEGGLFYYSNFYLFRFSSYAEKYLGYIASDDKRGLKRQFKGIKELVEGADLQKVNSLMMELGFINLYDFIHVLEGKGIKDLPSRPTVFSSARNKWGLEFRNRDDTKYMFKLIKGYVINSIREGEGRKSDYIPLVSDRKSAGALYEQAKIPNIKGTVKGFTISHRVPHPVDKAGKVVNTLRASNPLELKQTGEFMVERLAGMIEEMVKSGTIKERVSTPKVKKPRVKVEVKSKMRDL
jgi:hypothetical protein